ncbi:MAG TPA: isoleucine--tRNA ligase, partial [candidate division WWE3 bacterium]|nr:isoleucine--tRNA ligase [candidate division WWE3 bacterium]
MKKLKKLKNVDSALNLPKVEESLLRYWDKAGIPNKVLNSRKGKEKKILYDGPITANNMPHYGHVVTWTIKDVFPRYWTMQGFDASRNIGWDCQGIPVEYEVEKAQGFTSKQDIEKFGVAKFNKLCKESVLKYVDVMLSYERRIGRWVDRNDEYWTMDPKYIESMWWSLKELYKKGLLYEGYKVVAYSTRAGTTLSNAEVALGGYSEVVDPAITVKFPLKDSSNTYFLAWTTTPWTIPGNLLLSVGKNISYVEVEVEGANYILAKEALERVFGDMKYKIVREYKAQELVG